MDRYRGILSNVFVIVVLVAAGWMSRGWLEDQSSNWPSILFTLQIAIPAIIAAVWFSINEQIVKITLVRIIINLAIIGGLLWWYSQLVIPRDYGWSDSLPTIGGLLIGLLAGVTFLSWIKPHLADWPWWGAFRRQN